jgi:hypothetical protein
MKKVLLAAIVLAASTLVGVGATATPADALTCVGKSNSKSIAGTFGNSDSSWLITSTVTWNRCTTDNGVYARIRSVRVTIARQQGGCGNGSSALDAGIDYWRANPNTVAGWDPGSKTTDCGGDVRSILFDAPAGRDAWAGDTYNQRCVGGTITGVHPNWNDATRDLPDICII